MTSLIEGIVTSLVTAEHDFRYSIKNLVPDSNVTAVGPTTSNRQPHRASVAGGNQALMSQQPLWGTFVTHQRFEITPSASDGGLTGRAVTIIVFLPELSVVWMPANRSVSGRNRWFNGLIAGRSKEVRPLVENRRTSRRPAGPGPLTSFQGNGGIDMECGRSSSPPPSGHFEKCRFKLNFILVGKNYQ